MATSAPTGASVQLAVPGMKLPMLSDENDTLSVTVAVHDVAWLITTVLGPHDMLVMVWCAWTGIVTARLNASLLAV